MRCTQTPKVYVNSIPGPSVGVTEECFMVGVNVVVQDYFLRRMYTWSVFKSVKIHVQSVPGNFGDRNLFRCYG